VSPALHPEPGRPQLSANAKYERRAVAFVDILGFADLVRQADRNEELRSHVIDALQRVRAVSSPTDEPGESDLKTQNFSDSLILSARGNAHGLWHLLFALDALSWNLLAMGVLVRGGVTIENVFHDETTVFGVGVNEAHGLESGIAKFPRIVLGRRALDAAEEAAREHAIWRTFQQARMRRDDDGVWFLHYLLDLAVFNTSEGAVEEKRKHILFKAGVSIRQTIQDKLDGVVESPSIYEKVAWLARYWNRTVAPADRWDEDLAVGPVKLAGEV
jgi:hypothetical protein